MKVNICGYGQVAPGEYEGVSISGSGKMSGLVRCDSFSSSGTSKGGELDCKGAVKISGSSSFSGSVRGDSLTVSGAMELGGHLTINGELKCSGALECGGSIHCTTLKVSGDVETDGGVEAESVTISGILDCEGLLNAETIAITGAGMKIGSIGGSSITIRRAKAMSKLSRIPLLSSVLKTVSGEVVVPGGIEGDTIVLENVKTPTVSGRAVTIEADCDIDLVRYSESITVSPKARVGRTEQI